jgi:hypothetical protein
MTDELSDKIGLNTITTFIGAFFSVFVTILVVLLSLEIILFKTTTLCFLAPCNHVFHSINIYFKRVFIIQCYSFHNTLCRMTFMIRSSKNIVTKTETKVYTIVFDKRVICENHTTKPYGMLCDHYRSSVKDGLFKCLIKFVFTTILV